MVTALVLILLTSALVAWHARAQQTDLAAGPEGILSMALYPLQVALTSVLRAVGRGWDFLVRLRTLYAENLHLQAQVEQLRAQNEELLEYVYEVQRLRKLVQLKEHVRGRHLTARVIGRGPSNWFHTLMLNVGRREGVEEGDIVEAEGGLVGQVYEVTKFTCKVLLITDRRSSVGALVQPERSRAVGVCKGTGRDFCTLQYLPKEADVRVGDTVISSGFGGVFPKGIVIGRVTDVQRNDYNSSLEAKVQPHVDFDRLEEVFVLLQGEALRGEEE